MLNDWLASFEALKAVYADDVYSNMAINEAVDRYNCSHGFVRVMTKGVIRRSIELDYIVDNLADRGIKGIKKRSLLVIKMGLYAAKYMDSVPFYAAVNEAVSLAGCVCKSSRGFVNAILRSYARAVESAEDVEGFSVASETPSDLFLPDRNDNLIKYLSIKHSFPENIVELLLEQYGAVEGEDILEALNDPPALFVRCNNLKIARDELVEVFKNSGIECCVAQDTLSGIKISRGEVTGLREFSHGFFSVQTLSSIKAVEAFAPESGSRVLDMCAAPGGKTAAIAEFMHDNGEILACDIYDHKMKLIKSNAARLGITSIKTQNLDGTVYNPDFVCTFDYVLADVPCSGLGTVSTKPEIKYKAKINSDLPEIQLKILENAYLYVKEGGYFMYSTCTLNKLENEDVINQFLVRHDDVCEVENNLLLPYNNNVGFFYCKMRKVSKI